MTLDVETENLATRARLREVIAAVEGLDPVHRHLLQQAFTEGRTLAAEADQPGLARVYDSLQALVLQLRQAWGDT